MEIIRNINTSISLSAMDLIVRKDRGNVDIEYSNKVDTLFNKVWSYKNELEEDANTKERKKLVNEIMISFKKLEPIIKENLPTLVKEKASDEEFENLDENIESAVGMMDHHIKQLISSLQKELNKADLEEIAYSENIKQYTILTIILAIIISLFIASYVTRNITLSLRSFQEGLLDFFKFLNKESEETTLLNQSNDEIGEMAKIVNQNIKFTKLNIKEDRKFIDQTIKVLSEFEKGDLSQRLNITVNNPSLMQLKFVIDSMASNIETNINNV